jgi:hypothetical protein
LRRFPKSGSFRKKLSPTDQIIVDSIIQTMVVDADEPARSPAPRSSSVRSTNTVDSFAPSHASTMPYSDLGDESSQVEADDADVAGLPSCFGSFLRRCHPTTDEPQSPRATKEPTPIVRTTTPLKPTPSYATDTWASALQRARASAPATPAQTPPKRAVQTATQTPPKPEAPTAKPLPATSETAPRRRLCAKTRIPGSGVKPVNPKPKGRKKDVLQTRRELKIKGQHIALAKIDKNNKKAKNKKTDNKLIPDDAPLSGARKSGPTNESNPRSEIVAFIADGESKRSVSQKQNDLAHIWKKLGN